MQSHYTTATTSSRDGGSCTLVARLSCACSAVELRLWAPGAAARWAVTRIRARSGWLELPQRPPVPETGAHLTELHPEVGHTALQAGNRPRAARARARGEDGVCPQVPSSGIEPASPALRAGAITRSATRASCGRGGARPRASSTIRLSESCFVA